MEFRLASAAFVLVFAIYLVLGGLGVTDPGDTGSRDAAYNLQARGLLSGHLYIEQAAPAPLRDLSDPYNPVANKAVREDPRYRLHDLSYYGGHLYLYFGVAPALLVFLPWHLLTGGWLGHWEAVLLLCSAGLLVNLSLVHAIKVRIFPGSPPWGMAVSALILGLGSYAPLLLARADVWEVPIAFCYLAVAVALRCLWTAFEQPARAAPWIAVASAALGAAFAARPNVLPAAAILAAPFFLGNVRRRPAAWAAAAIPLALCGAGVALFNFGRFGDPFQFGQHYQLSGDYEGNVRHFSGSFVATNLHLYLFKGVEWLPYFPYAHEGDVGALPQGHGLVEHISGALLNAPILLAALAVAALAPGGGRRGRFLLFAAAVAWVGLSSLALLSFYFGTCSRYQFEFAPALALLASVGIMALEDAWGPGVRCATRWIWIPALLFSCAFTVLYGLDRCVSDRADFGLNELRNGNLQAAAADFGIADALSPRSRLGRLGTGMLYLREGRAPEAQGVFEGLVHDFPGFAMGHFGLGNALAAEGRTDAAVAELTTAQALDPSNSNIHSALEYDRARRGAAKP